MGGVDRDLTLTEWNFAEVWMDPNLFPPYILLLLSHQSESYCVYDPAKENKLIFRVKPTKKLEIG